jgi:cardiolipin synthase C
MAGKRAYSLMRGIVLVLSTLILLHFPVGLHAGHMEMVAGWKGQDGQSGIYVLEQGWEALAARAWMIEHAQERLDSMVFIWDMDDVGLWATAAMLRAAERGVRVRILIDDFTMANEPLETILALSCHPFLDIRIFNPRINVGVSIPELVYNAFFRFRELNQRMHNKTFIMDGVSGLTGGRNMANDYFGHHPERAFQDRDILIIGAEVSAMEANFQRFWESPLSRPIEELIPEKVGSMDQPTREALYKDLHAKANRFASEAPVLQSVIADENRWFSRMLEEMTWARARFISDPPERSAEERLGGDSTVPRTIGELILEARERITIQTPYFVLPQGSLQEINSAIERGVQVRVSTNSLSTTDNIAAFSGYANDREQLLEAGYTLRELKPNSELEEIIPGVEEKTIHLHAKTLVVDGEILFVGTMNIDPRSVHLHTEEGVIVYDQGLAEEVEKRIERLMAPGNSWDPARVDTDGQAKLWKRIWLGFLRLLPLRPML